LVLPITNVMTSNKEYLQKTRRDFYFRPQTNS